MTDRELELKLKAAVERTAPDGLERLLSEIENGKGVIKMEKTTHKKRFHWAGLIAACLAIALVGGFGGFWYGQNYAVATTVSLDVNPSIELSVNRAEKVLKCSPLNAEAKEVLSSMDDGRDLEGAKLDVAVNAIVGAIVRAGYLDSLDSAILISVDDKDADRGARLQAQLVATVDGVLKNAASAANVMSQNVTTDAATAGKAQQYGISTGKAAYIEQILALNPDLDYAGLAGLTVEELRDLIRIGAPAMPIGKGQAVLAASEYAGVLALDSVVPDVDPELDDPVPHYEVELTWGDHRSEYKYTVDAFTGEVLSGLKDAVNASAGGTAPTVTPAVTADEAFNAAAEYFTEKHSELNGNFLNIKTEYDREDGRYDVEFWCVGWEFDYDVDGQTGQVLREETDYRYTPASQDDPAPAEADIGVDAAKAAALRHAGLGESQVTFLKAQRDYDDGRLVYEVDFYTADTEYDYEIAAADGAVLKSEREARPGAQTPSTPAPATDIGVEAAKAAALEHAGLTAGEVTFLHARQDYDDGKLVYDVDFYTDTSEYDYEIDAATGAVLKSETEKRPGTTPSATDIGESAAKEAALKRAGVTGSVEWLKVEHDYDNGRHYYELEFECDATVYECDVDAATGDVVKFESEPCDNILHHHDDSSHDHDSSHHSSGTGDIGADAAKSAALAHAGLSESQVTRLKCEKDLDDGRTVYEVDFTSNGWEYEYKIDAATGAILEHERDRDD